MFKVQRTTDRNLPNDLLQKLRHLLTSSVQHSWLRLCWPKSNAEMLLIGKAPQVCQLVKLAAPTHWNTKYRLSLFLLLCTHVHSGVNQHPFNPAPPLKWEGGGFHGWARAANWPLMASSGLSCTSGPESQVAGVFPVTESTVVPLTLLSSSLFSQANARMVTGTASAFRTLQSDCEPLTTAEASILARWLDHRQAPSHPTASLAHIRPLKLNMKSAWEAAAIYIARERERECCLSLWVQTSSGWLHCLP